MELFIHLIAYSSILVFVVAVVTRFVRITRYPINLRWEVYPVPTEGARAKHGGSRLEDLDWWENERKPDRIMEMRYMIPEMVLLQALFEHNRKLWYRSFPFHFGLYLLAGFVGILLITVMLPLVGLGVPGWLLMVCTGLLGAAIALSLLGSLGLLLMRLTDGDLKPYTNFSHIFNLVFFLGALGLLVMAWREAGWQIAGFQTYLASLLTGDLAATVEGVWMRSTIVVFSLLVAWIPLTHMSHFFVKWFTWHKIRWDDEPNVRGGRIEKLVRKALESPVTWAAPHIGADGKKNWVDIAVEEVQGK